MWKKIGLIITLIFSFGLSWGDLPYVEAPNNGFVNIEPESPKAQWLLKKYQDGSGSSLDNTNLANLKLSDFFKLNKIQTRYYIEALKLFKMGQVIVIDSVVGNATRLGNPKGGKGSIVIGHDITFLDAKIIRVALDSQVIGRPIPHILWSSDENMSAAEQKLDTLVNRLKRNPKVSYSIRKAVEVYLESKSIVIMAHSELFPVIDEKGQLTTQRYRNLGAGELIKTINSSGAGQLVGLNKDSKVVFSNIDFDVNYIEVIAASIAARNPDLFQVHVRSKSSGGSAYWQSDGGRKRIVPLESIEVPEYILKQSVSLNTNTVVLQGNALDLELYEALPIPFEKKTYEEGVMYLPKISLSDVGKDRKVRTEVALGNKKIWFFEGSKDIELLKEQGEVEINRRLNRWNRLRKTPAKISCKQWLQN